MAKSKTKKKRRLANARKRAEQTSGGFARTAYNVPEGLPLFKFKEDKTLRISILPFVLQHDTDYGDEGDLYYESTFYVHGQLGPNQNAYCCPARMKDKSCPVCSVAANAREDGDDELAKSLRPKERNLFLVFDHEEPDKGVQLWDVSSFLFSQTLHTKIRKADEDDNYDTFFDPEDGLMLRVEVEECHFNNNKFYKTVGIEFRKRPESIPVEVLKHAEEIDLDSLFVIKDHDDLESIYYQVATDDKPSSSEQSASDDEPEEKPKKKKDKKKKKKDDVPF